ncbi:hypothetical protein L1987_25766 [Smallanthus sonchifolius]|uniref:Uncharacterized protein n=1 Tax=Smallanthus sonchifolius TaxID=185202 RepID=A0ACB9I943_9ASTR|nr:hypothetical protein L1987_25766 [Smallanthus sonchifolius]
MTCVKNLAFSITLLSICCFTFTQGANFNVINQCPYTVWAAVSTGGGRRLERGQSWQVNVAPGTPKARIWGRTGCSFDANGRGKCATGDCNGMLECRGYGVAPNTLAEFALNQYANLDYVDISLVDGFNIPMEFSPVGASCKTMRCAANLNSQCPQPLRTQGGCNNPCTVFNIVKYCCTSVRGSCGPTEYSKYFKDRCPDTYTYPQDDQTGLFTCPAGTNYKVVFCP